MVCELATLQSLTQCLEHPEQLELIFFLQIYALSYEVVFWHCRPRESPVQKSNPGRCFFATQHSLSKQQKGRRGQKKIKRKKNPFPSPTNTQTTVPNRGAIQDCSEMGHKEKCLQIKPTLFFLTSALVFLFFVFFPNKHHGGPWKVLGIFESSGPADPFCPPLAQLPRWP